MHTGTISDKRPTSLVTFGPVWQRCHKRIRHEMQNPAKGTCSGHRTAEQLRFSTQVRGPPPHRHIVEHTTLQ
jgi:hypothetical protein